MDMTKYAGQSFVKLDDVRDGPIQEQIAAFGMGKFDRPVLTFENGDALSLNQTNVRVLIRAYGKDGRSWIGHTVELYAGETEFEGKTQQSVLISPVSKPTQEQAAVATKRDAAIVPPHDKMDDELPW
jgi:hypothetical protein